MSQREQPAAIILHRALSVLLLRFILQIALLYLTLCFLNWLRNYTQITLLPTKAFIGNLYYVCFTLMLLETVRQYFDEIYIFGPKSLVHFKGRLSLHLQKTSIAYRDIREAFVKQSLLGRIMCYGTIMFGTSSTDKLEVVFRDLYNPREISRKVQNIITTSRKATKLTLSELNGHESSQ